MASPSKIKDSSNASSANASNDWDSVVSIRESELSNTVAQGLLKGVTVSRFMRPDDANVSGNVHGGSIMNYIEEAGMILASKYCNLAEKKEVGQREPVMATMVRIEKIDFLLPMYIGEVASFEAEIMFTSAHSLEVLVMVHADNCITGESRLTNLAKLWYVPVAEMDFSKVCKVPPMIHPEVEKQMEGLRDYGIQKEERSKYSPRMICRALSLPVGSATDMREFGVSYSQSTLVHFVGPSDVTTSKNCRGGVVLKLMDEVARVVAAKHCKTNVVTASLDATNFHKRIALGGLISLTGQAIFTSLKSMEIQVMVDVELLHEHKTSRMRAVDAYFTFVSLGEDGKPRPIPQLMLSNKEEEQRFAEGKKRYEKRKQARLAEKKLTTVPEKVDSKISKH